jgi:hypothetical protein
MQPRRIQDVARILLGLIRSFNGAVALFAPRKLLRRLQVDPAGNGAAIYALRMFGVRTILLGGELFVLHGERREEALRQGVLIHASDTTAALLALAFKQLPRRAAATAVVISSFNTALALLGQKRAGEWLIMPPFPRPAASGRAL